MLFVFMQNNLIDIFLLKKNSPILFILFVCNSIIWDIESVLVSSQDFIMDVFDVAESDTLLPGSKLIWFDFL